MNSLMKTVEESSSNNEVRERYCDGEVERITNILSKGIPREDIKYRPAGGGQKVGYIEGYRAVEYCNDIFGFNGWSFSLVSSTIDVMDEKNGSYTVGLSCLVQVTLKDGTFRQDVGYGSMENSKSKVTAFEKAKKEAVTDGLKRCLRLFGYRLGGCVYDKSFLAGKRESSIRHFAKPERTENLIKLTNSSSIDSYRINQLPRCSQNLDIKIQNNHSNTLPSSSAYLQPTSLPQPTSLTNFPSNSNTLSSSTYLQSGSGQNNNGLHAVTTNNSLIKNSNIPSSSAYISNENGQSNNVVQTASTNKSLVPNSNAQSNIQNMTRSTPYNLYANKPTNTNGSFADSSISNNQVSASNIVNNNRYAPSNQLGQFTPSQINSSSNNMFVTPNSTNINLPTVNNNYLFGSNSKKNTSNNLNLNYTESEETALLCDVKDPIDFLVPDGGDYDYEQLYSSSPYPDIISETLAPIPPSNSTPSNPTSSGNTNQNHSNTSFSTITTTTDLPQPKFDGFKTITDPSTGFTSFQTSNAPYIKPNKRCSPRLNMLNQRQQHQHQVGRSRESSKLKPSTSKNG